MNSVNNDVLNQMAVGTTTNCILPYTPYTGCGIYPYVAPSGPSLSIEKLPGGFIITANGRREIVATVEALSAYLQRWNEAK
jgi:hypothetical protein